MENKYTVEELASKLKVSKKTILREVARGKLRTEKVGRRYLVSESSLETYLNPLPELKSQRTKIPDIYEADTPKKGQPNLSPEHHFQDENRDNGGPTCLSIVYNLRGIDKSLESILSDLKLPENGEITYPSQLARHLELHGVRTNLIVSNSQFISPAWKNLGKHQIMENLKNWLSFQPKHEWHLHGLHTLFYLEEGGDLELKPFDSVYLKKLLDRGSILILCVDEVWLRGHRFREYNSQFDDLRARTWGHFIVVNGYKENKFTVLDPYPTGLNGRGGDYEVEDLDLVNATLTWSATILEVLD